MPTIDKRVDDYINSKNEFAIPILLKLRKALHKACPEVTETIKWGMPTFEYKGILCGMAAFKAHCIFNFWKYKLLKDKYGLMEKGERTAMGVFGKITSVKDLPSEKILMSYIKQAMKLNEDVVKAAPKPRLKERKELIIPENFQQALNKNLIAKDNFEKMSYSHKKEYVEYIEEAKREETRVNRISKSIQKLEEAKSHNWKYEKC